MALCLTFCPFEAFDSKNIKLKDISKTGKVHPVTLEDLNDLINEDLMTFLTGLSETIKFDSIKIFIH